MLQAALRNKAVFLYHKKAEGAGSKSVKRESVDNLRLKYTAGGLTATAKKDIRRRVDNWQWAVTASQRLWSKGRERRRRYFVLITLTLAAKQTESDNVIKRKYLNVWLQNLERVHKGINWLWVAESQKNGNIHFHVVVDRYVQYEWIKRSWNRVMSNGDYIDRYERKFGNRNPPSVNVHGQKAMGNPAAYITKYLTGDKFVRELGGRKWGCCDKLREIDHWSLIDGERLGNFIADNYAGEITEIRQNTHSTAIFFKQSLLHNGLWDTVLDDWRLFVCHTLGAFYAELNQVLPPDIPEDIYREEMQQLRP